MIDVRKLKNNNGESSRNKGPSTGLDLDYDQYGGRYQNISVIGGESGENRYSNVDLNGEGSGSAFPDNPFVERVSNYSQNKVQNQHPLRRIGGGSDGENSC